MRMFFKRAPPGDELPVPATPHPMVRCTSLLGNVRDGILTIREGTGCGPPRMTASREKPELDNPAIDSNRAGYGNYRVLQRSIITMESQSRDTEGRYVGAMMRKEFHPTHAQAGMAGRDRSRLVAEARAKASLIVHQRIAEHLLSMSDAQAQEMCERARAEVGRWHAGASLPAENINAWIEILNLPVGEIAKAIVSDMNGRGNSLRENSPWKSAKS